MKVRDALFESPLTEKLSEDVINVIDEAVNDVINMFLSADPEIIYRVLRGATAEEQEYAIKECDGRNVRDIAYYILYERIYDLDLHSIDYMLQEA